ncbi:ATP-binding protein [Egbenema bharatensis]|uniref:ATP-binding protein n=1 Tax=Egbenema bharatensis TaxID=3463334 RepID=UPI003A83A35A
MVLKDSIDATPVNARANDRFDLFDFKYYPGPNPYLERGALVFNFAQTDYDDPPPLSDFIEIIAERYPHIQQDTTYDSYAHLLARTAVEVGKLDMELHMERWSVTGEPSQPIKIAVEAIHEATSHGVVYAVWDWFESICRGQSFQVEEQIKLLQTRFRRSVYGGPTVYALLQSANKKGIPTVYLPDEGLMQYGYGRKQVRGIATTFDRDSHLDSDFTTRKDDCKAFLHALGFPVPIGDIVITLDEAFRVADRIGYPVAVKPVVGHKGIGVTAEVNDDKDLEFAFDRAVMAHGEDQRIRVIIERHISGHDFRLLCVDGKFVAATERRAASVVGDGESTIAELIEQENAKPERLDTPTSALGKIIEDEAMDRYLDEQGLSLDSIPAPNEVIYLRKVANLSSGGVSIDATLKVHPDNIILAQDIAQHFSLVCLGIDILAADISRSWREGNFGIVEINSAPGVYMHLRPAVGERVEVADRILETFFSSGSDARIPIISFNYITIEEIQELIDQITMKHPTWVIGAACRDGVFINRSQKHMAGSYNNKIQSLLRNPKLDLLIAEYSHDILQDSGCFYDLSDIVVLDNPTATEMSLAHNIRDYETIVIKQDDVVSIRSHGLIDRYTLGEHEPFKRVYWKQIAAIL